MRRQGLVVGTVLLAVLTSCSDEPAKPPAADPEVSAPATSDVPTSPEGTRLVGVGRVAVYVPESWGTQELNSCYIPDQPTVLFADAPGHATSLECASTDFERFPHVRFD